jgi:hypothetical protein
VLALCILAAAIATGHFSGRRLRRQQRRAARKAAAPGGPRPPAAQETTRIPVGAAPPRLFRGDDSATTQLPTPKPKIFRPPND